MRSTDVYVDDTPPVIVYQYGVLNSSVTGNTSMYSGASSLITPNIVITTGFIFNLSGFSGNEISRVDIIDNVIDNVYDNVDTDINKYMVEVLIASSDSGGTLISSGSTFDNPITEMGYYLCRFSIADSSGNRNTQYHILWVTNTAIIESCFNTGNWRDNKVWIDTTFWRDFPI